MSWIKREDGEHEKDKKAWSDSGMSWIKKNWGNANTAWLKRSNDQTANVEHSDKEIDQADDETKH